MTEAELKGRRLEIIRSQALQLELTAENTTYMGAQSVEEQYYRLRDSLVSIDNEADRYLPDYRRKSHDSNITIAVMVDLRELIERMRIAIQQLNAYLNPQTFEEKTKGSTNQKEIMVPAEVLKNLPMEIRRTIEGVCYNYHEGFIDFCFWGMRKALIDGIRIRFIRDKKEKMLYDNNGEPYKLSKWIELAKQERYFSSPVARELSSQVKVFGDVASHDYMANLQKEEVARVMAHLRIALSRMYYQEKRQIEDSR